MLRLFWMSLVAFVLWKIFDRKNEYPSTAVLIASDILAALLFAAAHLPATAAMIGLSPLTIFRCFLLNGGVGLLFGWLYRKYGLRYSMIAHGGCHIVSKLIWILFVWLPFLLFKASLFYVQMKAFIYTKAYHNYNISSKNKGWLNAIFVFLLYRKLLALWAI